MKSIFPAIIVSLCISCTTEDHSTRLNGTYRLLKTETIKGADTTHLVIDPSKAEMLKIFNDTHFAFFNHDKSGGKDSISTFVSGSGTYELKENAYTENLDFCNFREWEGKQFHFTLTFTGDTLVQVGEEVIPELNINQKIKETYVRLKTNNP